MGTLEQLTHEMEEPVSFTPPTASVPPVPTGRAVWPWVVGAIVLLGFAVPTAFVIGFGVNSVVSRSADEAQSAAVEASVFSFDDAYRAADCDTFERVTDPDLRDDMFDGDYNCDDWLTAAGLLVDEGRYRYDVKVLESEIRGTEAVVHTREFNNQGDEFVDQNFAYELNLVDGDWVIIDYYSE